MQKPRDDPRNEGKKTSNLCLALEAAMQIQKRKVIVGPNDAAGVLLFNTVSSSCAVALCLVLMHFFLAEVKENGEGRAWRDGIQDWNISLSTSNPNRRPEDSEPNPTSSWYPA